MGGGDSITLITHHGISITYDRDPIYDTSLDSQCDGESNSVGPRF